MLTRFRLLKDIGQFQSTASPAVSPLLKYVLVYAENGRGKTTLSAIFHSLASGNPLAVKERSRLGSRDTPLVVLESSEGPPPFIFRNGGWNRTLPELVVFDDIFVDENVYSGLSVEADHRQNLHELVIGSEGVALNRRLQEYVSGVEAHNTELRNRANAIPSRELGAYSVDTFCDLPIQADAETAIRNAERALAGARHQDSIRTTSVFSAISVPDFNTPQITETLAQTLTSLDVAAFSRVQEHFQSLGRGAEAWVREGVSRVVHAKDGEECPFCIQDLRGSSIIGQYRAYFSREYASLRERVSTTLRILTAEHSRDIPQRLERAIGNAIQLRTFWAQFSELPTISFETEGFIQDWQTARDGLVASLETKIATPLKPVIVATETSDAVGRFRAGRESLRLLSEALTGANRGIEAVKTGAASSNAQALQRELDRLLACQRRHSPQLASLCEAYLAERRAKVATERLRDQTREQLERHRQAAFPRYQTGINTYLGRFGVGFRIDRVTPADTRGGATCNYDVVINNVSIPIGAAPTQPAQPCFRNTLSAGDRSALALSFFFASLDSDPNLAQRVVVIDDPLSSLDEHRSFTTVQEIRRLGGRVAQLIVLSHNKAFLGRVWEGIGRDATICRPLKIQRAGQASVIEDWDVTTDSVTEHDRNHLLLRNYVQNGPGSDSRPVAAALRPVLEGFIRVAFPEHCPPRPRAFSDFIGVCRQRLGANNEILNTQDFNELLEVVEYGNLFHHETNAAWETVPINDAELRGYVIRVLEFASR